MPLNTPLSHRRKRRRVGTLRLIVLFGRPLHGAPRNLLQTETAEEALKHVYEDERPQLKCNPERRGCFMIWDVYEMGLTLDMADEHDRHNSSFVLAPQGNARR